MKRSHSDVIIALSPLPAFADPRLFKDLLTGSYNLRVTKVADISKPVDRPVEEIEEPEDGETQWQNRLNKSNARMIQLDLKDSNCKDIRAIETEPIDLLTGVRPNCVVSITGPVDIRCGNIMLEKRHVAEVSAPMKEEEIKEEAQAPREIKPVVPVVNVLEDWDEDDEEDCVILD